MAKDPSQTTPTEIRDALITLRKRIRIYVIVHGILLAVVWLGVAYWFSLALDYLPVLMGWNEMAVATRALLLGVVAVGLGWILTRWSLRRAIASISDESLALVLERRFPELGDSLATAIQGKVAIQGNDQESSETHDELFEKTLSMARSRLDKIAINDVFDFKPIRRLAYLSALLLAGIACLGIWQPGVLATSLQRLYLLNAKPWERNCHVEVVGLKIKRETALEHIPEANQTIRFIDGQATVGTSSSITLLVRASAVRSNSVKNQVSQRVIPRLCQLSYETADGNRGRVELQKVSGVRDGFQMYSTDEQIMQGLLSDLKFYIRGGDHRIGPFEVRCVPNPIVAKTEIHCDFPEYLSDSQSLRWSDRTVEWNRGMRLPTGTVYTFNVQSNRPLKKVYVLDVGGQLVSTLSISPDEPFQFEYHPSGDTAFKPISFVLCDQDELVAETAFPVGVEATLDLPPLIDSRLDGIGTAITPQAIVPLAGTVRDEYGVHRTWVQVERSEEKPLKFELPLNADMSIDGTIDFRKLRRSENNPLVLSTDPGSQITITVMASDYYDLDDSHAPGAGDRYLLDVVSPNEMLRILERLEAAQRRRLEQIYNEMTEARSYLVRVHSSGRSLDAGLEPGDETGGTDDAETGDPDIDADDSREPTQLEMQSLFNQRALMQVQKSAQEILGVAESFEDIRRQLINNRVDSKDRKIRLENAIVTPLHKIAGQSMVQLEQRVMEQAQLLDSIQGDSEESLVMSVDSMANQTLAQADVVLLEIQQVLDLLIKFETQNELLDIVRQMIDNQKRLMNRTQEERNRQAFEGLLK